MNFETIKKELTKYEGCKLETNRYWDRESDKYYDRDRITLTFTLHGDYVGYTIDKSNYAVFADRLESISPSDRSENIVTIETRYRTKHYAIAGDLTAKEYELVKDCLESIETYPILDDQHYSQQEREDCLESYNSWQKNDIIAELGSNYGVDPETVGDRLLDVLLELEQIETREENACSYWDLDEDNYQEIADRLSPELMPEPTQCRW